MLSLPVPIVLLEALRQLKRVIRSATTMPPIDVAGNPSGSVLIDQAKKVPLIDAGGNPAGTIKVSEVVAFFHR